MLIFPTALVPVPVKAHTIIPCLTINPEGLRHGVHGVMGGFLQPQGQAQILSAGLGDELDPQPALDRPRFCVNPDDLLAFEEGIPEETVAALSAMGHPTSVVIGYARKLLRRGQIIKNEDCLLILGSSVKCVRLSAVGIGIILSRAADQNQLGEG